jgi:hypothetical protein
MVVRMARGGTRSKQPTRGRGAASKPPPSRSSASHTDTEAAPAAPSRRGRPPKPRVEHEELSIGEIERLLETPGGLKKLDAITAYRLLIGGMSREDTQATLGLARRIDKGFAALREIERDEQDRDLAAQLSELRQLLGGRAGNSMRASAAVVPPLKGTDQLREDMAPSASAERGGEPCSA